jgi:DNA-binding CsgD family transcriptional regulator
VVVRSPVIVGRGPELQTVRTVLAAARGGHGGAVFLVGESGIGKSRLAIAAADFAFSANMRLLRGRGSAIGPMVPFRSLIEALLSLLHNDGPIDVDQLGPYRPILARLVPDWGEPAEPEAGSVVILAEAVLRLTALAGEGRGCLLILDDLQDADAETLAVVEFLVDNLERQPTALIATIRDGTGPAMRLARSAAQRGVGTLIELPRLDRGDLRLLAASCLDVEPGQLPEPAADLLWAGSAGNPFLAEEILTGMVDGGLLALADDGWRLGNRQHSELPATFARSLARRMSLLDAAAKDLLSVAAVLGERFPLALLRTITGRTDRHLLGHLHGEIAAQLAQPDEQSPDWYAFRHRLIREALLSMLGPGELAVLARRAADAVVLTYPGLRGEWCQLAASLLVEAEDPAAAGRLFVDAGKRALAQGAAESAVALLDRAIEVLPPADVSARAEATETVLYALAEAGRVEQARDRVTELDRVGGLDPRRRARLHTCLAWAEGVGGHAAESLAQLKAARALLGADATAEDIAPIDVVAAYFEADEQLDRAEELARRAATVAEAVPLPVVACQAWQLLSAVLRPRDPDEATVCLERAHAIAVQHDLPIWAIHALVRLGSLDILRNGSIDRIDQARQQATRAGAVSERYLAETSLALHYALCGEFTAANTLVEQVLTATARLRLIDVTHQALLTRAIMAAHRGQRREMDRAFAEFRRWGGAELPLYVPRIHGLTRGFCALLEEDREQAQDELATAMRAERSTPTIFALSGQYGMNLLLGALIGDLDRSEYDSVTACPASRHRWDRQFALFARAVLAGRSGDVAEAEASVTEALAVAAPYAVGRHLALRLVSEAALADGWGQPVQWLRQAENYFHLASVPAVASACRAMLRSTGEKVGQHRDGSADIPLRLRCAGVTVREYEVFRYLVDRSSNREIADRLHLSPRTVERHVSSLMAKTGLPNRVALGQLACTITPHPSRAPVG